MLNSLLLMRRFPSLLVAALLLAWAAPSQGKPLRIASVQMELSNRIEDNLSRILRGIEEARVAGARVVVFPETALSGFDRETIQALNWEQLTNASLRIALAADANNLYVLYGTATESGKDRPFNSAVVIGPDGNEVFRYHKMVPEGWFEPGDRLALFKIDDVTCTMIICHDSRYPELVRLPAIAGARICFYPSYEINSLPSALQKMEGYRAQLIARAVENGIFLVQSNGIGGVPGSEKGGIVLGHSRMVHPSGRVLVEAPALEDTTLVEDIDPEEATRGNCLKSPRIALLSDWWNEGLARLPNLPNGQLTLQPHLRKSLPYKVEQIAPICLTFESPFAIAVRPDSPHKTFADLVEAGRKNPGKVSYGLSGIGSVPHLLFHMVAVRAKTEFNAVAYKNYSLLAPDILEGRIDFGVMAFGSFQSPPMKLLAVLREKRHPRYKDVPTSTELGFPAESGAFGGLYAPAATPKPILAQLEAACERTFKAASVQKMLDDTGAGTEYEGSAGFARRLAADSANKAEAVRLLDLKVQ